MAGSKKSEVVVDWWFREILYLAILPIDQLLPKWCAKWRGMVLNIVLIFRDIGWSQYFYDIPCYWIYFLLLNIV